MTVDLEAWDKVESEGTTEEWVVACVSNARKAKAEIAELRAEVEAVEENRRMWQKRADDAEIAEIAIKRVQAAFAAHHAALTEKAQAEAKRYRNVLVHARLLTVSAVPQEKLSGLIHVRKDLAAQLAQEIDAALKSGGTGGV